MEALLPPRLGALLELIDDRTFGERLTRVHEAAARAIDRLGDLDLGRYDDTPLGGSADLSLWEEVAPALASTMQDVNALLGEIRARFPSGTMYSDRKQGEIDVIIQSAALHLQSEVQAMGGLMRDPAIVSDRWALLSELQSFRFRFRERIGNAVYETAVVLDDVKRQEVEPGYQEALAAALTVRSMTADLRRLMRARLQTLSEAEVEDVEWNHAQLEKELDVFGKTPAWKALRAQDKKRILEFREQLVSLPKVNLRKESLVAIVGPFVQFIESFDQVNKRDMLLTHDRERVAAVGVLLEQVITLADSSPAEAARVFDEALNEGMGLYGREGSLDIMLRKMRKSRPPPAELAIAAEGLVAQVAALQLY